MADPLAQFEAEATHLLAQALDTLAPDGAQLPSLSLEVPKAGQADLAAACFPLAKPLRRAPAQVADDLAKRLTALLDPNGWIARVDASSGYVNFHIRRQRLTETVVPLVLEQGEAYGSLDSRPGRVMLEHTSANPTGPLHVGRARNPIIGDTLARILRRGGWDLKTQYYLDDVGKQMAVLAWARENIDDADLPPAERQKPDYVGVRYYQEANRRLAGDEAANALVQQLMHASEQADEATLARLEAAYGPILGGMFQSMTVLGVEFDDVVKESQFIQNGETERVIKLLQLTPVSRAEEDGALWLDLSDYGVHGRSQRFVYRRSDGTSLYATRDVAYHLWKTEQADRLINVLGEDHKLHAKQVRVCLELLGARHVPEVVFYSFVTLPEGKMSTRKGRVVYLDDLIDEAVALAYNEVKKRRGDELDEATMRSIAKAVGVGALRYNIVRVQAEKAITFRWEDALNFEGASAPFLQYAYARCASILRKAGSDDVVGAPDVRLLVHAAEHALAMAIARLPRVIDEAGRRAAPHLVATYAQDLAACLNAFYRDCPVLTAPTADIRAARLGLVRASRLALHATLHTLGVPALEEM